MKALSASSGSTGVFGNILLASANAKSSAVVPSKVTSSLTSDEIASTITTLPVPDSMNVSQSKSVQNSVFMDESMFACDAFKSPEVEYIDNNDISAIDSNNRNTFRNLHISSDSEITGNICSRDIFTRMEAAMDHFGL